MHELVRAEKLLQTIKSRGFQEPVHLSILHLEGTQIYLEEVIECFNLVTQNTIYQSSEIEFSSQPKMLICQNCNWEISVEDPVFECENCSSNNLRLFKDDELEILEINPL